MTTDPAGQYSSPYLGMGNNPINGTDPDGGKFFTDYKNKQTGETVHVNDGIDQVVEIDQKHWDWAVSLSENYDPGNFIHNFMNYSLQKGGTLRPDLFYTINNVLEGQSVVSYASTGDCEDAARGQCNNAGVQPQWRNGGIHMLVDNDVQKQYGGRNLTANRASAISTINTELVAGNPLMLGLSYGGDVGNTSNTNKLVGHFVVLVGRGNDVGGNYYIFLDNVTTQTHKLHFQSNNTFSNSTYIGTEIRPNIN